MSDSESDTTLENEPQWLDLSYVEKILQNYTNNQLNEVKYFNKQPATEKGENYASIMNLITTKYTIKSAPEEVQELSMIVKSRLENEIFAQIEEDYNVFSRETQVYTEIMSEAQKLLRSIGDETIFGPKALYVDDRVIVQENLKLKGYNIENVKDGLNFEHCQLVLAKLAKFHAVTMALYKKNPDMFRYHLPGNISEHPSPLHDLYTNTIRTTIEYCKKVPKLKQYAVKLEAFGEKIIPKMINVFSRNQSDRFHALNHGDVWVNNLMFRKSDNGELKDVLLVDYQEGFFGSPGIDWNYFIFSSWQTDVFQNHFESLLEFYHSVLSDILHKLNYEQRIPTVDDVRKEIINKGFHGLATTTCLLPILINEHLHLTDPINFLIETDEAYANRQIIFDNPKFGERLEVFLAFFMENGIL